jgi:hypothetical protein
MATNVVNLDALIPREDFEVIPQKEWRRTDTVRVTDLHENAFFYTALRKPDFQRETANWSPQKIQDFVKTFLAGDLIPAIILWSAGETVFVIDGAHRLSALIAWVQNDYGDGDKSRKFFRNHIPDEQQRAADSTRILIGKSIGTYAEHKSAAEHPENSRAEVIEAAKRLGSLALQLQWVPSGDARKAEASFFKINQEATAIDPTELRILKARTSPNAVSARVIVRNATGHKYWSKFPPDEQAEIEEIGQEIYKNLFDPPLRTPIKSLDHLPVAGRGYSAQTLPLIFEMVNLANGVQVVDSSKKVVLPDKNASAGTGGDTLSFLKNTRKVSRLITGTHPSSLGLHPALYFYSAGGRYQPTAFLAVVDLVIQLERNRRLKEFIRVRRAFEDFLLARKNFVNQITVKRGSGAKGFATLSALFSFVLAALGNGKRDAEVVSSLRADDRFSFLNPDDRSNLASESDKSGAPFSRETKSAAFLKEALANPLRCKICDGLIHFNSIHFDHATRKAEGGAGTLENARLVHPYCDSALNQ